MSKEKTTSIAKCYKPGNSLRITRSALRLDFAFSTSLLEIYTLKVSPKCWKRDQQYLFLES
jgi:hypothetical protein